MTDPANPHFYQQHRKIKKLGSENSSLSIWLKPCLDLMGKLYYSIMPLLPLLSRLVVSDSVRPHRQQPTRLPRPWDSPGKNTGVDCYFLLQCMKVKSQSEVAQSCLTFSDAMDCSLPGSSVHGIFQARVLEWGAISYSRGSSQSRD